MMMKCRPMFVSLSILAAAQFAHAAAPPSLASLFTDHMVLQRDQKIPVWGKAEPGTKVSVSIASAGSSSKEQTSVKATADSKGRWQAMLPAMKVGDPLELNVTVDHDGKTSSIAKLTDVLVGDVWLCSGQSNMGFQLKTAKTGKEDIAKSANPQLRLFQVAQNPSATRLDELTSSTGWMVCGPETTPNFTAVGYYFGRDLQKHLNIPIGLLQSSVGGTSAECWMSREALREFPEFNSQVEVIEAEAKDPKIAQERYERLLAEWNRQQEAKAAGTTFTRAITSGTLTRKPGAAGHPRRTMVLFNGMIAPLVPFALKGAIWYQGESNVSRAEQYQRLFPAMIKDWRNQWNAPNLPFLFVQLPYFHAQKREPADDTWAELREAQLIAARKVPHAAMVTTVDTGDAKNIHPADKEPVGARLALAARATAYGEKVEYSGPLFTTATIEGANVRCKFDHVGSGLSTWDNAPAVRGFAVAGADHKFAWADAKIDPATNTVVVSSAQVPQPVAVRYAWAAYPDCNLANKEGLPASPFRSDDFPLLTHGNTTDSAPPAQ